MTKYEKALAEANRFLGEADDQNPQIINIQKQITNLENRLEPIDRQRNQIILQIQNLKKQLIQLGGTTTA